MKLTTPFNINFFYFTLFVVYIIMLEFVAITSCPLLVFLSHCFFFLFVTSRQSYVAK